MDIKTVTSTLRPLLNLSNEVTETNFSYQMLLATQILQTGKPVEQMTLAEIQQLIEQANDEYEGS